MRVDNSIRNIITALIGQGLGILLSFIGRMVFISTLGAEYLGVNGLFTNVLSILSLAEMGVGSAIVYSLYKPLATKETKEIKGLMNFYRVVYRGIGILIFILGIVLVPFIGYIVKDQPDIPHLTLIYLLFLINTVVSYFFAYKRSLIIADQKGYITTIYKYGFFIILNMVQIGILVATKNFILFLLAQVMITVLENLVVAHKADKMYPFMNEGESVKLDKENIRVIVKNVRAMLYHKIGGVIVDGTDNILISGFVGIIWVGLYSNYYLVINAFNIIIQQIFTAITASVGNLNVVESKEKSYSMYKRILFMNFWMVGFCSVCLWVLFNPFITLWIGDEYLLEHGLVFIIVVNFYIRMTRRTTIVYRDSLGLFWNDRYKPLCEAVINIVASVLLAPSLGIAGVFIGTLISTLTTAFWVEPYIVYKYAFEMKVRDYFFKWIKYTSVIVMAGFITYKVCGIFRTITWMSLFGRAIICVVIPNLIFWGCFYKTDEFKYYITLLNELVLTRLKSKINKIRGGEKMRLNKHKQYENSSILDSNSSFDIKESYKVIRTNLIFSMLQEGCKKIVVSSAYSGEGKTSTCINLAITFAETGKKVIVLDGDLRKPRVHTILNGSKEQGLSHVLGGFSQLEEAIQTSTYENLDFITAGVVPPNPAELLASKEMDKVLKELSKIYDYIFIDTPPINVVTDGTILACKASGIVLVVKQNTTKYKDIQMVLEQLQMVQAKVLGTILNGIKISARGYGRYGKKYDNYS